MTQIALSFRKSPPAAERRAAPPKDANARRCRKRAMAALLLALAMMVVWIPTPAYAQEVSSDLTALSLEELMGLDVLAIRKNKVRFEINADAAKQAGLKISSKLLRLAKIVR